MLIDNPFRTNPYLRTLPYNLELESQGTHPNLKLVK